MLAPYAKCVVEETGNSFARAVPALSSSTLSDSKAYSIYELCIV